MNFNRWKKAVLAELNKPLDLGLTERDYASVNLAAIHRLSPDPVRGARLVKAVAAFSNTPERMGEQKKDAPPVAAGRASANQRNQLQFKQPQHSTGTGRLSNGKGA